MKQRLPIRFRGTGSYLPKEILDNAHFSAYLDTTDEWILTRTGIRERHRAAPDECTSTMAAEAARRALDDAGMEAGELDAIVCATATGDRPWPATAAYIQDHLGAGHVAAFDIGAACSGFIYGTTVVSGLVSAGMFKNVLLVGAETLTRFTDPQDRATCVLLGDAAGAAIVSAATTAEQGVLYWTLGCDGDKTDAIVLPAGGSRLPASQNTVAERLHYMKMKGREVFKFAVLKMQSLIDDALAALKITPDDLAMIIPHQSNLRIIQSMRERMGLPKEKVSINIDRYGNTSSASVALGLDEARRSGTVKQGDLVMLLAVGAGLSWGLIVLRL